MNGYTSKTAFEHVYSDTTYALLKEEFVRDENICYLEHAGATLYSSRQISHICDDLKSNIFANPHARSSSSKLTEDLIDQARIEILHHFNTFSKDYTVIFTSGATGALKLLAESFNYANDDGIFAYLQDNHTSVLGMREFAKNILPLPTKTAKEIFKNSTEDATNTESNKGTITNNSLFVFPAQSNFSGTKYNLDWIEKVQSGAINNTSLSNCSRWYCCLDAACFVSTNHLDLSKYRPDFVCLSFYKIFGYPTGLGALIVNNGSAEVLLKRNYFGGGTVFMALATEKFMVPRTSLHERFEDGTLSFLSILSLRQGFATLKRLQLQMEDISKHTFNLAKYTHDKMAALHHNNGSRLCKLYTDNNFESIEKQGGIINFNLLDSEGRYIGFAQFWLELENIRVPGRITIHCWQECRNKIGRIQVLHIANLFGIQVRTGCFCNPGACQEHLNLTIDDLNKHYEAGHVCGDQNDLIDGQPTGSVRISFGYMSTKMDADIFLKTIIDCFCQKPIVFKNGNVKQESSNKYTRFGVKSQSRNGVLSNDSSSLVTQNGGNVHDRFSIVKACHTGVLKNIYIYPIKSCAAFEIKDTWSLTSKGLKFDRNWMIVNDSGVCVTQKQNINLCKLKPTIDLDRNVVTLHYEDAVPVSVPLTLSLETDKLNRTNSCQTKVCKDVIAALDCGDSVARWISTVLNQSGLRLLRQNDGDSSRCTKSNAEMSLANEAQYLLVNLSSVKWLQSHIKDNNIVDDLTSMVYRFRPNFVVDFDLAFIENDFTSFLLENDVHFASEGHCTRCQMICFNQLTGEKTIEPLKTLSKLLNGKISFGVYLRKCDKPGDKRFDVVVKPNCNIEAE